MSNPITPIVRAEEKVAQRAAAKRDTVAERYPLTFALIGTFGVVSTFYGFEKLIDRIDLFVNHPWILLVIGVATLSVTGLALRKLG